MADATSKLNILITAKNETSSVINQIKTETGGLTSALGGMATALGVGFGALGAEQLGSMVVDMARAGAEAERLATGFNTLADQAGQSGDAMLAAMQKASQGTISDSQLMLDANKAMLLGVTNNSEQMTQLMEAAAARGHAMGESTAAAFDDIVTGIGRLSPKILDNLGIVLDTKQVYADYAQQLGTTADQLSEAEQKQALLNAVVKDSADLVKANQAAGGDAADNFERMDAAITNAKEALGEMFSPAIAAIAQKLADTVNAVTDSLTTTKLEGAQSSMHDLGVQITDLAKAYQTAKLETDVALLHPEMMDQAQQHLENAQKQLQAFGLEYNKAATIAHAPLLDLSALQQGIVAFGQMAPAIDKVGVAALNTIPAFQQMTAAALAAREQFNQLMDANAQISSAANQAGVLFAAKQGGDAGLSKQKAVTTELQTQNQQWLNMGYSQKEITDVLMPGYVQNLNEADQATFKVATGTAKISDAAKAANQAFDDLKGKVASVLQSALNTGTGVDPQAALEKMGFPREDAINENARRLADIAANGLKNQDWLGQFQQQVPDIWKMIRLAQNPQEEAARLLADFQDGLLTSPIDKGKAKEIVRRQILGEENMAAYTQEIATELSQEMGVSMQTALSAAQGTLGGGQGAGGQAASQFTDGAISALDDTGGGGAVVSKFSDQMRASYPLLQSAGRDAGKMWGSGFLETVGAAVPPALIKILVDLVTPGVMAAMAQKSTLTAATP
jgi:hypothetical protein